MRLCDVAEALVLVVFLTAKADTSANAIASPTPSGALSSAKDRPGTLNSEPPDARDEERMENLELFTRGNEVSTVLIKSKQTFWNTFQLKLKVAWWSVKSVDPDFVYAKLELNHVKENIVSNPWFRLWVKYVDKYNLKHPAKKVSILTKLQRQFSLLKLSMMLDQAKREENTSIQAIGTRLQNEQMSFWIDHDFPPDRLYKILQANRVQPILLTGRAYDIWSTYFTKFNRDKALPLIDQLCQTFDDQSLSLLLLASKQSEETAAQASGLQFELEKVWLDKGISPELVFKYLLLDRTPTGLLDNPELTAWMRYADAYWMNTGTDVSLEEIIKTNFDAERIKIIIETAKTEGGKEYADRLTELAAAHA